MTPAGSPHAAALPAPGSRWLLFRAVVTGPALEHPVRAVLATAAIALGVGLGVAVHLINASALNEMATAARQLAGEADVVVRGASSGFDEALYPMVARLPGVAVVNPGLEVDVPLADRPLTLSIFALDALRARELQPDLLPQEPGLLTDLFEADAILLSAASAEALGVAPGERIAVQVGTRSISLRVAGLLPAAFRQRMAVMDIAAAQWRFGALGRLNRLDIRLEPGVHVEAFRQKLQARLPAGAHAVTPAAEAGRGADFTRAYRLNLNMLALVALFTGAFLIFSTQWLALVRRRGQLALLRALGITRAELTRRLVAEGAVMGVAGSAIGLALGYVLARYAMNVIGPDLGAGYFRHVVADLDAQTPWLSALFGLGVLFAVLGVVQPARESAQRPPARGLRAGDAEDELDSGRPRNWGIACLAAGAGLAFAPPIGDLPVAGYLSIALILLGIVLAMPWLAARALRFVPLPRRPAPALAIAQIQATPRQSAVSVAAIVISMSLMVAMLIMVASFRGSLETWLERVLPADLYVRAARGGETAYFTPEEQARLAATPGVERVEFIRSRRLALTPERPPLTLLAGPVHASDPARHLPLIGPVRTPRPGEPPPVWLSEIAADALGLKVGERIVLPIGNTASPYMVSGIWRDYARQNGAIAINRELYRSVSGDHSVNEAALWVAPGTPLDRVQRAIRDRFPDAARLEIATPAQLRRASLALFDRTFAITYALEAAAVFIGLFGVSVSFSAQALARRREFGVLRHIGMRRREIAAMLGCEGALAAALGALVGATAGGAIGLILIHVVNRQSFHWSMELDIPWLALLGLAAVIVVAAAATAAWAGRGAMGHDVVRAVREDW